MSGLPDQLGLSPFRQRPPWLGPDLQTLRDMLREPRHPTISTRLEEIDVGGGDRLIGALHEPAGRPGSALVVVLHGLGGCSEGPGPRRLARALEARGMAVLRLNLRGAGPGRCHARGTYSALSLGDMRPALHHARRLAQDRPLYGVGISLGGTVLLNACLHAEAGLPLDGIVCISSPMDLALCARRFERWRNRAYSHWLVNRLRQLTLADPYGLRPGEHRALSGPERVRSVRAFDAAITAPRWGYRSVEQYYAEASPLAALLKGAPLPPALLLQARDDPWVPADPLDRLAALQVSTGAGVGVELLITPSGGHNGFHSPRDGRRGCWSDRLAAAWLERLPKSSC